MPFERVWTGIDLTSNWTRGKPPTSLQVEIALDPFYETHLTTKSVLPLQNKKGIVYGNERFKMRNGKISFDKNKIEFDMIPEDIRVPAKLFKGTLVKSGKDYVAIQGTVTPHPIWLTGQSQEMYSAYKGYKATVTLH